jgi:integrase
MIRARYKTGSVVFDKRRKVWNYLFCENGYRRTKTIGSKREYPTKSAAWSAVESLRNTPVEPKPTAVTATPTVAMLVKHYRSEKMPKRFSTRYSYDQWLVNHVLPRWGNCAITELQARPVEMWLLSLPLAPKSRVAIRGLLGILWDFAMWRGNVPTQRNPMELVTIKGGTKRQKLRPAYQRMSRPEVDGCRLVEWQAQSGACNRSPAS